MTVRTFGLWTVPAATIARTYLAVTLLLSAWVGLSHLTRLTFYAVPVFLLEFLLATAIAEGWLIRYAAALVFLGTITVRMLAPHFHLALLPANMGTTVVVLIASGILLCFGQETDELVTPLIENNKTSGTNSCAFPDGLCAGDVEVRVRLEEDHVSSPRRGRCVVTVYEEGVIARKTGQEAWYARNER